MLALSAVLVAVIAALLWRYFSIRNPSPSREGQNWTHNELLAYSAKQGVTCNIEANSKPGWPGDPWVDVRITGTHSQTVTITLCKSSDAARERVGTMGVEGYYWGRFAFTGKPTHIDYFRQVLE